MSDSNCFAERLVQHANSFGMGMQLVLNANAALASCLLGVTCTSANSIVLKVPPPARHFQRRASINSAGAVTPGMAELSPGLCQHITKQGKDLPGPIGAAREVGEFAASQRESAHWASVDHGGRCSANRTSPGETGFFCSRAAVGRAGI